MHHGDTGYYTKYAVSIALAALILGSVAVMPLTPAFSQSTGGSLSFDKVQYFVGETATITADDSGCPTNYNPDVVDTLDIFLSTSPSGQFLTTLAPETGSNTEIFVVDVMFTSGPTSEFGGNELHVEVGDTVTANFDFCNDVTTEVHIVSSDRILYGTDASGGNLYSIDKTTGAPTLIGSMGVSPIPSLAIDPATGMMYAGRGGGNPFLYTVDPNTGLATLVGDSGLGFAAIGGMDFAPDGTLYASVNVAGDGGTGSDHLATIDKTTGLATVIGPFGTCTGVILPVPDPEVVFPTPGSCDLERMEAIAFANDGTLYGATTSGSGGTGELYTIDVATGHATFVANILDAAGQPHPGGVSSLQFDIDGTLYAGTSRKGVEGTGDLLRIDPANGTFTPVGTTFATKSLGALALNRSFATLTADNATPAWGQSFTATFASNLSGTQVVFSWDDGTPDEIVSVDPGPIQVDATHEYDATNIGLTKNISATLQGGEGETVATSNVQVLVERQDTNLTVGGPASAVAETGRVTPRGTLTAAIDGRGISGMITFDTSAGFTIPATNTVEISIAGPEEGAGIQIVSCNVPLCTPYNPDAPTVNVLKLEPGTVLSIPSGVIQAAFDLQDMSGTATVTGTRSDGESTSTFTVTSDAAGMDLPTLIVSARDSTHPTEFLESIMIEGSSVPGERVGISAIELFDNNANPPSLVRATFDSMEPGDYGSELAVATGGYYSTGTAPAAVQPGNTIAANFAGDALYKPASAGPIEFETELGFSLGIGGAFAAFANPNPAFTVLGCSAADPDDDKDGLCNSWEETNPLVDPRGIPYSCGDLTCYFELPITTVPSTDPPVVQEGKKNHKDIYVEIDAMEGQAPLDAALKRAVDAFAAAPVSNGDGVTGITLHIIKDEMNLAHVGRADGTGPLFSAWVDDVLGGDDGDGTNDYFGVKGLHYGTTDAERTDMALKNARANAIRYNLWVDSLGTSDTSGLGENLGNDFIVSLGNFGGNDNGFGGSQGTETEQASTFVHELGHGLGLGHGGPTETLTSISGAQSNERGSNGALSSSRTTKILTGLTLTTNGPTSGSPRVTLEQVVNFSAATTVTGTPTISKSGNHANFGTPTVTVTNGATSTQKKFTVNYPFTDTSAEGTADMALGQLTISFTVARNPGLALPFTYPTMTLPYGTGAYPTVSTILPPDSDKNCKPNYRSVMSYSRQMDVYLNGAGEFVLDYSGGKYASLTENNLLDEALGLSSTAVFASPTNTIIYGNPGAALPTDQVKTALTYGPAEPPISIDWDSSILSGIVGANINNLSISGCDTGLPTDFDTVTFKDYNDWKNLKLNWKGSAGTSFDGVFPPPLESSDELTQTIVEQAEAQVPTIHVDTVTDATLEIGQSTGIAGSTSTTPVPAEVTIHWGNGDVTSGIQVDPATGLWPAGGGVVDHTYGFGDIGENLIVADLLDSSDAVVASSSGTTIFVGIRGIEITKGSCPIPENMFKDIFTPDNNNPAYYRDTASNPGQFRDNIVLTGRPGTPVSIDVTLPYPMVTQGSNPIRAHDMVDINSDGCFTSSGSVPFTVTGLTTITPSGDYAVVLGDYGPSPFIDTDSSPGTTTKTFNISGEMPSTGIFYITIHLDFGLEKTGPWARGIDDNATPVAPNTNPVIPNGALFTFGATGLADENLTKANIFKHSPGFFGVVTDMNTGDPISGVLVQFFDSNNNQIGQTTTDENGYYSYYYKYTGKASTVTIRLPDYSAQASATMKANGMVGVNFEV